MGTPHAPRTTSAIACQKSDLFLPWGATRLSRLCACARRNGTGPRTDLHFLKLIHVAKIGTKPCELESHRLRMDSSHMQPCFSGSLLGCAGRAPAHAPHARSLDVQLLPTLSYALPPVRNASHASWLTCRSLCVQLIHDAHVHHRMRSSCGTVVTVLRRHTKRSSSCLPRCLRLNC